MSSCGTPADFDDALKDVVSHVQARFNTLDSLPVIPSSSSITDALSSIPAKLPQNGVGSKQALDMILKDIVPGMWQGHAGPRMYGFVTGGVTPAAQLAEMVATSYDEQVQVSLPQATISTAFEQITCDLVLDLLEIPRSTFKGKTLTTGATASNILGISVGRDALLLKSPHLPPNYSIAEDGFPSHVPLPSGGSLPPVQIMTVKAHGSIMKAAAVTGIGRSNVLNGSPMGTSSPEDIWGLGFDLIDLEEKLKTAQEAGAGVIVAVALGEVNTGGFTPKIKAISELCKQYGGWLHIDGAFGGFAALCPEWAYLKDDMMLADSLSLDAHKWLNAPYDTAIFFTREAADLKRSFGPSTRFGAPPYLKPMPIPESELELLSPEQRKLREWQSALESPLNLGIENSRRARALPLFAALMENGRSGYEELVRRNVAFARKVGTWMAASPSFEVLNLTTEELSGVESGPEGVVPLNVVLFRGSPSSPYPPEDITSSSRLIAAINGTRKIYVSGSAWAGAGAVRLAVSNWRTAREDDVNGDFEVVVEALTEAMAQ